MSERMLRDVRLNISEMGEKARKEKQKEKRKKRTKE
jgi:hypothetical protein